MYLSPLPGYLVPISTKYSLNTPFPNTLSLHSYSSPLPRTQPNLALTSHALHLASVWLRSVDNEGHHTEHQKPSQCTSPLIGRFFSSKIHTYHFKRVPYNWCRFGCDRTTTNTSCSSLYFTTQCLLYCTLVKSIDLTSSVKTVRYLSINSLFVGGQIPPLVVMCFIMVLLRGSSILHT